MLRRVVGLVLVLMLLPAAAPASTSTLASLSDLIDGADLIAVGRVVEREGDPRTFGFAQHQLEIERVLKGDRPAIAPRLLGYRKVTYDLETGEIVGYHARSVGVAWRHGERVLTFLHRGDESDTWRAHKLGVRRLPSGDHSIFAEKIAELLDLQRRLEGLERVDAQRAWALSLLDHSATLRDAAIELTLGDGYFDEAPRLGEFSDADRRRILLAVVRHGDATGWEHGYVLWLLIPLAGHARSAELDEALAVYVTKQSRPSLRERQGYATLLAERLDDDALRELAREFEQLADSPRANSEDAGARSAWLDEVNERAWAFRSAAFDSIRRFHE